MPLAEELILTGSRDLSRSYQKALPNTQLDVNYDNQPTQDHAKEEIKQPICKFCKRPGHLITTCRYKKRKEKEHETEHLRKQAELIKKGNELIETFAQQIQTLMNEVLNTFKQVEMKMLNCISEIRQKHSETRPLTQKKEATLTDTRKKNTNKCKMKKSSKPERVFSFDARILQEHDPLQDDFDSRRWCIDTRFETCNLEKDVLVIIDTDEDDLMVRPVWWDRNKPIPELRSFWWEIAKTEMRGLREQEQEHLSEMLSHIKINKKERKI